MNLKFIELLSACEKCIIQYIFENHWKYENKQEIKDGIPGLFEKKSCSNQNEFNDIKLQWKEHTFEFKNLNTRFKKLWIFLKNILDSDALSKLADLKYRKRNHIAHSRMINKKLYQSFKKDNNFNQLICQKNDKDTSISIEDIDFLLEILFKVCANLTCDTGSLKNYHTDTVNWIKEFKENIKTYEKK